MARGSENTGLGQPLRRFFLGALIFILVLLLLLWRIDSPRAERFRANLVDRIVPNMEWALVPVTQVGRIFQDFSGYTRVYEQNQELRRELQRMRAWREVARQLEQENARLLDLNKVVLSPRLTYLSGVVMTDAGSPFRHSVLINVGARDGIEDGWAAMDGLGLVGRVAGVGQRSSRVMLVTDSNSHTPVTIQPIGLRAILSGDTTAAPPLDFLEGENQLRAGFRVVTSGDGGGFPPDLLVGTVVKDVEGRWRVRLAADIQRLEFLRVMRAPPREIISEVGGLIGGADPLEAPQ